MRRLLDIILFPFRSQRRSDHLLRAKQEEIDLANRQLQELNTTHQRLTAEKEWLLREIHHRVKNNLQIVISLLNMQSRYLKDEYALHAFGEISHRMHAISLIHQRLYQEKDDITAISMPVYIRELAHYLARNAATFGHIRFRLEIDPIELDITQSIPVGLILNEAITNAINYAFRNKPRGCIRISMHEDLYNKITLTIADDGLGLPASFNPDNNQSMGLRLIRTLTEQLDGQLFIYNDNGLTLTVGFRRETSTSPSLSRPIPG